MNYVLILIIGIPIIIIGIIAKYIYKTYNELIYFDIQAEKQASHVDVHLKKKFDLIPALSDVVKGYAGHESSVFKEVTRLRSQWGASKDIDKRIKTANQLESMLSKLLLIQERYPRLKADKNFRSLQKSIYHVEKELVHERKLYNRRVKGYNVRLRLFPRNIIAKLFGFKEREFFSLK